MATLEKIRNRAGLLVVVVGLALFAFILGDLLNSGSSYLRQAHDHVVDVNDTPIRLSDYQSRIEEMTNVYKMQPNAENLTDEINTQIRQAVYDAMVQEIVLKDASEQLGISVTPEELFDMIQGDNIAPMVQQFPYFTDPQTGTFSKTRALSVLKTIENINQAPADQQAELRQVHNYWLFWERNVKLQRMQDKYTQLLTKAVVANPLDAKNAYEESVVNSDIVYAMQPYSSIQDTLIQVNESDLKKIYNDRKEQFKQKDTRIVDYIAVDIRPSEEDFKNSKNDIDGVKNELALTNEVENIVNDNSEIPYMNAYISEKGLDEDMTQFVASAEIGDIQGPIFKNDSYRLFKLMDKKIGSDSVKVSHILLAALDGVVNDALTTLADSLLTVLKSGGDFQELAAKYSMDEQSGQTGGELGWFTESGALRMLGSEFKDMVFTKDVNQPQMLKTAYGIHLIKVTEKTASVTKYKLAYVYQSVTPSSKTYTTLFNNLNQFISVNNTPEKIKSAVQEAGYNLTTGVSLSGIDRTIGNIADSRPAVRWAFESSKKGEVSEVFECKEQFVVAIREDALAEGYIAYETIAPILKMELLGKKKGEEIVKNLKSKNLQSISDYANAMKSNVDTVRFVNMATPRISGIGAEPVLNAMITYTPLNQLSEPVIGTNGVYVFNVFNRASDAGEYSEQRQINAMQAESSNRIGYHSIQMLVDGSKIKDNRVRFD